MIPKKIHYCWFGRGEKPELAKKCIASWKKYCPDYEIVEWNEDNYNPNCNAYLRYWYERKNWALVSDFVRLDVVNTHGGFYFDTDVELLRSPDELQTFDAFYGFENEANINTGQGFGAVANHPTVEAMLEQYRKLIPDADGSFPLTSCPKFNTAALLPFGLELNGKRQNVAGAEILPEEYLNPYDSITGRMNRTDDTVSVHWYSQSWLSLGERLRSKLARPFHRLFGKQCFAWVNKKWRG